MIFPHIENAEHFTFLKVKFYLKTIEPIILNKFKGFTLRGGFGYIFKKTVCINFSRECEKCILKNKCAYAYIFETSFPENLTEQVTFKIAYPPHPYILEPPFDSKMIFNEGDEFAFNLILIGESIGYLPYFIFAFDELGRVGLGKDKGRYKLLKAEGANGEIIFQSGKIQDNINCISFRDIIDQCQHSSNVSTKNSQIKIHFVTPTRFVLKDELASEITFKMFMTNLLRRLSLLSIFHCNKELIFDYSSLLEEAENIETIAGKWEWCDLVRYSSRQKRKIILGGFLGEVSFHGNLDKFMPFIKLGEYIHVGKQTSFGLGRYEIEEVK